MFRVLSKAKDIHLILISGLVVLGKGILRAHLLLHFELIALTITDEQTYVYSVKVCGTVATGTLKLCQTEADFKRSCATELRSLRNEALSSVIITSDCTFT